MSTRWKVIVPTAVLAVMIGGAAWAATSEGSAQASGSPAGGSRPLAQRIAQARQAGSTGTAPSMARPGFGLLRIAHVMTNAQINVVVNGATHQLTVQHGDLTGTGDTSLTVKELDGSSVTVPVDGSTRVRLDGRSSSLSSLKTGDHVFTLQVDGGTVRFVVAFDRAPGLPEAGA